jgi:hypothetical protein
MSYLEYLIGSAGPHVEESQYLRPFVSALSWRGMKIRSKDSDSSPLKISPLKAIW